MEFVCVCVCVNVCVCYVCASVTHCPSGWYLLGKVSSQQFSLWEVVYLCDIWDAGVEYIKVNECFTLSEEVQEQNWQHRDLKTREISQRPARATLPPLPLSTHLLHSDKAPLKSMWHTREEAWLWAALLFVKYGYASSHLLRYFTFLGRYSIPLTFVF